VPEPAFNTAYLNACVDRWRDGDLGGRDALVRATGSRLEPLVRKMLRKFPNVRCWEQTDDVLQNALMRLLRTLENIRPKSTRDFFSLASIHIRRELIDLARHHRVRNELFTGSPEQSGPDILGQMPSPPDGAAERGELDRWCAFHEAVENLPDDEREVVSLVFYHGLTQARVGELIEVSERTVRRRWERGLEKLHALIGGPDV
jgi:RNA polymerase sigma factor (sigma-70 family)